MMNGTTHQMEMSSTNASAVINSAIGNSFDGDSIFVKSGTYNFGSGEYIDDAGKNNIQLIAEKGTVLNCTAYARPINLSSVSGWKISGFEIDANNFTQNYNWAFYLYDVNYSTVEDCYVHDVKYVTTSAWGYHISNCSFTNLVRCRVELCEHGGINFDNCRDCDMIECVGVNNAYNLTGRSCDFNLWGIVDQWTERCHIINCHGYGSGHYGAQIYQYCNSCSVQGGSYWDCYTAGVNLGNVQGKNFGCGAYGVTVGSSNRSRTPNRGIELSDNMAVVGCTIIDCNMGIEFRVNEANSCVVVGNTIRDCYYKGMRVYSSWNTISSNNIWGWSDAYADSRGLEVTGNNNTITGNTIRHVWDGILITGNFNIMGFNVFYVNDDPIQDTGTGNIDEHNMKESY